MKLVNNLPSLLVELLCCGKYCETELLNTLLKMCYSGAHLVLTL